jgi:hypothetical protein
MRKSYYEGLAKLNTNFFESKEAKSEWLKFVEDLTLAKLVAIKNNN